MRKNDKAMTKKQRVVYESVKKFISNGIVPTVREICDDTGLSSTSTVHSHLRTLERKGYITHDNKHRSLKITGIEPAASVPVFAQVTEEEDGLAFEEILGYVSVPVSKTVDKELFALKVSGESMKESGILDGDIVVCEKTCSARKGDIVIVMKDGTAVVKSLCKENDGIIGKVISLYRQF